MDREAALKLFKQMWANVMKVIGKLGGDPKRRALEPLGWGEASRIVCNELRQEERSEADVANLERVTADLRTITGLDDWSKLGLDAIAEY